MKIRFEQFHCGQHRVLLHGDPEIKVTSDGLAWEPSMANMTCPKGSACESEWGYDFSFEGRGKVSVDDEKL